MASTAEVEQIIKQLNHQIDVIQLLISQSSHLEREVILVKVSAPAESDKVLASINLSMQR